MSEKFVYVTRTERATYRFRVEADTDEAAIEAARAQAEAGEQGHWVMTHEDHDEWSQADVEEV